MSESRGDLTNAIIQLRAGDSMAVDVLTKEVYGALHTLATRQLQRERDGHMLSPTALVNEAYIKLVDQRTDWRNRAHFLAIASQVMRRVLMNYATKRRAFKRGSGQAPITFKDELMGAETSWSRWTRPSTG